MAEQNVDVPFPESGCIWEVFHLILQERISERIKIQEQIVEIVIFSGADSAAHWGQIVDFPKPWGLSRTTGGGRNRGRDSQRIGGWFWAPKRQPSRTFPCLRRG